jgi:hypothetical protein
MATKVKTAALILPARSVLKLSRPIASPPSTTVNCSHDKNVRSFAKKTVVSHMTWGGRGTFWFDADGERNSRSCSAVSLGVRGGLSTRMGLEEGLRRHGGGGG